jgi:itaconate CoA-transferase
MPVSFDEMFHERRRTADEAVAGIPSGARIAMGMAVAEPACLLRALAKRAAAGDVGDLRLHYLLSMAEAGRTVLQRDLLGAIRPMSLFHGANERALDKELLVAGLAPVDLVPSAFSQVPGMLTEVLGIDTFLTTVSPMDADGWFSFGTNTDYAYAVAERAERVILVVNPAMPWVDGRSRVHVSRVAALVEHDAPLIEVPRASPRAEDLAIARIIAGLARDGDCLQMGIGAVPEAACAELAGHRHLGIHTELLTPALTQLVDCGAVDDSRKNLHPGISIFTFAMGDRAFYRGLDRNPRYATYPVDYVNNCHVIAQNDNVLSVNATLEVALDGACNSEGLGDRQFSASGGQLDFVRGAGGSRGGRSIIACHATAAGGTVSRIVPHLHGPVTTPRNDVHIIVTEYGSADLRGKSLAERARALIAIAHPDFREPLSRAAHERFRW